MPDSILDLLALADLANVPRAHNGLLAVDVQKAAAGIALHRHFAKSLDEHRCSVKMQITLYAICIVCIVYLFRGL